MNDLLQLGTTQDSPTQFFVGFPASWSAHFQTSLFERGGQQAFSPHMEQIVSEKVSRSSWQIRCQRKDRIVLN